MVNSAREVCGSVKVGGKNPKNVWWNDVAKAEVERKEGAWKEILSTNEEVAKGRCMEVYKEGQKGG